MLDFFKLSLSEARFRLASDRSLKVCYDRTLANLEGASVQNNRGSTYSWEIDHVPTGESS